MIMVWVMILMTFFLALLGTTSAAAALNETELDCDMRVLSFRYAHYLQSSWRPHDDPVWKEIYDALGLKEICGYPWEEEHRKIKRKVRKTTETPHEKNKGECTTKNCLYVDANAVEGLVACDGSLQRPLPSLQGALDLSREIGDPYNTTILLRRGIHALDKTIQLGALDSGISLVGYAGEEVWISGGIEIRADTKWSWDCDLNLEVRVANLTDLLGGRKVPKVASLFAPNKRLIRARYPNGDPELSQWGYNSPDKYKYSIPPEQVLEWHRPPKGKVPTFTFVDLTHPPQGVPVKNDSAQSDFNTYASGKGGVCADVWGPDADSYWCSNASSGGWAEVDRECAVTGQLQIPDGMTYNLTSPVGQRMNKLWGGFAAVGGIVHSWHSQTWAMHMFEIASQSPGQFRFAPGGGRQGARNWCRCDQCNYIAPWCGQHQDPPYDDTRLIGGNWLVENVLVELDQPGEFYFDPKSKLLYLYPNKTETDSTGRKNLRLAMLETLISIGNGASDISISNLGFRDTTLTYIMGDWSPPSGGDWSLHRGGAVLIENASNIDLVNCTFRRLDGNAIFLSKQTRNVRIRRNVFEWLGESAIAMWGSTDGYDATSREFPMGTLIEGNIMRELGIFQKQSSAIAHNKAARTVIERNIMFNMPRAAINFNDMMGGGDEVQWNLIFNTCRESGDHGPINSWDRQPFMTDLREDTKSFVPDRRTIAFNLIFANYGAAEGVDNDDGSSWYHISRNVFYDAEGFKMDYGGHDSIFEDNLVISYPARRRRYAGSRCINFDSFLPNHGHVVRRNTCVVPNSSEQPIIQLEVCADSHAILLDNKYYTPIGTATVKCWDGQADSPIPMSQAQDLYGLEVGSQVFRTPTEAAAIISWALGTLFPTQPPDTMLA
jgi:hypothetical protein